MTRIGSRGISLIVAVVALAASFATAPAEAATFTYPSAGCTLLNGLSDCINNAGDGDHIIVKAGGARCGCGARGGLIGVKISMAARNGCGKTK